MGLPAPRLPLSPEDDLAFGCASEETREFVHGEMFAMSRGSPAHGLVAWPAAERSMAVESGCSRAFEETV